MQEMKKLNAQYVWRKLNKWKNSQNYLVIIFSTTNVLENGESMKKESIQLALFADK